MRRCFHVACRPFTGLIDGQVAAHYPLWPLVVFRGSYSICWCRPVVRSAHWVGSSCGGVSLRLPSGALMVVTLRWYLVALFSVAVVRGNFPSTLLSSSGVKPLISEAFFSGWFQGRTGGRYGLSTALLSGGGSSPRRPRGSRLSPVEGSGLAMSLRSRRRGKVPLPKGSTLKKEVIRWVESGRVEGLYKVTLSSMFTFDGLPKGLRLGSVMCDNVALGFKYPMPYVVFNDIFGSLLVPCMVTDNYGFNDTPVGG
eukprot:Gb_16953 [translate_table: standard]